MRMNSYLSSNNTLFTNYLPVNVKSPLTDFSNKRDRKKEQPKAIKQFESPTKINVELSYDDNSV